MAYSKNLKQRNKALHIADVSGSLHRQILEVIMENGFLIKERNWNEGQMEIRATYDSFRIINLVSNHLSNDR
jgi:hypothetical protein